ncbi:MAG TPA: hypothetical protein VLF66_06785 [Thermoanaerobaculia bacterium]|nr:hypothetical protein [Thermoanaerobaculia bacterium]
MGNLLWAMSPLTITALVLLTILLGIVVLLLVLGGRPHRHKNVPLSELQKYLRVLLHRGCQGGFMQIHLPGKKTEGLQFSKYILREGAVGLQLDFPLASWSKPYYPKLKHVLGQSGVPFSIQTTETPAVPEFLVVDAGDDLERAADLSRLLLSKVFGHSLDAAVEVTYGNTTVRL